MDVADEILQKKGLKLEDLNPEERAIYFSWKQVLDSNQMSVEYVRSFVSSLREKISDELSAFEEIPFNWISVVSMFIPFYGLIRKWYIDRKKLFLEARLKNIILIEAFLMGPIKARQAIERMASNIDSK